MAPPPSRLAIATASVHRLLKEEASYRTELRSQEARLTRLQQGAEDDTDNDNREWEIGQEVSCLCSSLEEEGTFVSLLRGER